MAKVGRYIHVVKDDTQVAGVAVAFDAGKNTAISLNSSMGSGARSDRWSGVIESLVIKCSVASGAPTKLTVRATMDGETVLPDTEADINLNIGSSTVGSVVFKAGLAWASHESDVLTVYCHCDAGTVDIDEVMCVWSE
jgi:hypothetical protein